MGEDQIDRFRRKTDGSPTATIIRCDRRFMSSYQVRTVFCQLGTGSREGQTAVSSRYCMPGRSVRERLLGSDVEKLVVRAGRHRQARQITAIELGFSGLVLGSRPPSSASSRP